MNSLSTRLTQVEADLQKLHANARDLDRTLREIKKESLQEDPILAAPIPSPPPIKKAIQPIGPPRERIFPKEMPATEETPQPAVQHTNFEMQLGRVWFVRIGIFLLTTGLVFLSSYTYKNYVHDLGPGIRLTLLYLFSAGLTGLGLFCEQWKESLRNYGRIVAAGGLAALFYTSYAAHNVEPLKVIDSPITGSLLMIVTALFCGGISIKKGSKLIFGSSLALAFYAVILNPIGWMVGLSALILSLGGAFIVRAKKWTELHYLGLIGAYSSYAIWAFSTATFSPAMQGFLIAFWVLFVAITILEKIPEHRLFCSLNHSAFFLLFSLNPLTKTWITNQWLFALVLGTAILTIGILSRTRFPRHSFLLHLIKGLGLITLGLMLKLSGQQLFLTLLLESVILIGLHLKISSRFLPIASYLIAGISIVAYLEKAPVLPSQTWFIATFLWAAFALLHRLSVREKPQNQENEPWIPSFIGFSMVFLTFSFGALQDVALWKTMLLLGSLGVVTAFLQLKKQHLRLFLDFYWVSNFAASIALLGLLLTETGPSLLLSGTFIAFLLHLLHGLISRNCTNDLERPFWAGVSIFHFSLGVAFLAVAIHHGVMDTSHRMLLYLALPLLGTLLASKTKLILHASIPFILNFALIFHFTLDNFTLFAGLLILITHLFALRKLHHHPDRKILETMTFLLASGFWFTLVVNTQGLGTDHLFILTWSAVGLLLLHKYYTKPVVSLVAAPFFLIGIGADLYLGLPLGKSMAPLYLGLAAPLGLHLTSARIKLPEKHTIVGVLSLLILWFVITADVSDSARAASWAILGTLALLAGLFTKSRPFRVTALIILATTLGHIMLIDVVKLNPLPRILSFITLGMGLLGLGFVYNRWQEKLKQIL